MPPTRNTVSWPWFIVGCILLAAALVAFFWGFSLGELTESQRFLLMWILPLASGFAAGCFAGSLKATGTVGTLTVAATGGFAVWLLSFLLLPKPTHLPDSFTINFPQPIKFEAAARIIARRDQFSVDFINCSEALLNSTIRSGPIAAKNPQATIEKLKLEVLDKPMPQKYKVNKNEENKIYEIQGE